MADGPEANLNIKVTGDVGGGISKGKGEGGSISTGEKTPSLPGAMPSGVIPVEEIKPKLTIFGGLVDEFNLNMKEMKPEGAAESIGSLGGLSTAVASASMMFVGLTGGLSVIIDLVTSLARFSGPLSAALAKFEVAVQAIMMTIADAVGPVLVPIMDVITTVVEILGKFAPLLKITLIPLQMAAELLKVFADGIAWLLDQAPFSWFFGGKKEGEAGADEEAAIQESVIPNFPEMIEPLNRSLGDVVNTTGQVVDQTSESAGYEQRSMRYSAETGTWLTDIISLINAFSPVGAVMKGVEWLSGDEDKKSRQRKREEDARDESTWQRRRRFTQAVEVAEQPQKVADNAMNEWLKQLNNVAIPKGSQGFFAIVGA